MADPTPSPSVIAFVTDPKIVTPAQVSELRAIILDVVQCDNPGVDLPIGDLIDLKVPAMGREFDLHVVMFTEHVNTKSFDAMLETLEGPKPATLLQKAGLGWVAEGLKLIWERLRGAGAD